MNSKVYEYSLFRDGKKIYSGTKKQIVKLLHTSNKPLQEAAENNTEFKGFFVEKKLKKIEEIIELNLENFEFLVTKQEEKDLKYLKYLKKHLLEYGNTCIGHMSKKRLEFLLNELEKKEGIKTKYRGVRYQGEKKRYVIEVI